MMKKKLVALALSILMVLSVFAGCGSGATEPISADPNNTKPAFDGASSAETGGQALPSSADRFC